MLSDLVREYEKTSVAMTGVFSEVPPERVELSLSD